MPNKISKNSTKISTDVSNPSNWNFGTKCLQAGWKPKVGRAPRIADFPVDHIQIRRC